MHLRRLRHRTCNLDCGKRAIQYISFIGAVRQRCIRILPADGKDFKAFCHQMAHHAHFFVQIEDVIFIDPGRHYHDRYRMHPVAYRTVMDHFHDVIAKDNRAGCYCQIRTRLKRFGVRRLHIACNDIRKKIPDPIVHACAIAFPCLPDRDRIGPEKITGCCRIDPLPCPKCTTPPFFFRYAWRVVDDALQPAGVHEVALHRQAFDRVFVPDTVGKTLVGAYRLGAWSGGSARHGGKGIEVQHSHAERTFLLNLQYFFRMLEPSVLKGKESSANTERIESHDELELCFPGNANGVYFATE